MEDKKNDYTLKEEQIAKLQAQAFVGHPARVAILPFFWQSGEGPAIWGDT